MLGGCGVHHEVVEFKAVWGTPTFGPKVMSSNPYKNQGCIVITEKQNPGNHFNYIKKLTHTLTQLSAISIDIFPRSVTCGFLIDVPTAAKTYLSAPKNNFPQYNNILPHDLSELLVLLIIIGIGIGYWINSDSEWISLYVGLLIS